MIALSLGLAVIEAVAGRNRHPNRAAAARNQPLGQGQASGNVAI